MIARFIHRLIDEELSWDSYAEILARLPVNY